MNGIISSAVFDDIHAIAMSAGSIEDRYRKTAQRIEQYKRDIAWLLEDTIRRNYTTSLTSKLANACAYDGDEAAALYRQALTVLAIESESDTP